MTPPLAAAPGVRVQAPAKLNLLLRVLAREASGFHAIESLFVKLALHDVVTVRTDVPTCTLTCTGPTMPAGGLGAPESNLAWRAAEAFRDATGFPKAWKIDIEKRIPVGGGLGGGSADAAAVLRGLNALAPEPLATTELLAIAGRLGSDVPFLVSDALLAWSWGRGDRLLQLPDVPVADVTLLSTDRGVDTGEAYRRLAAARATTAHEAAAEFYAVDAFATWTQIASRARNDFETVVPDLHVGVAAAIQQVRMWAAAEQSVGRPAIGLLSGSGATCYLLAPAGSGAVSRHTMSAELAAGGWQLIRTETARAIVPPELIF